MRFEKLKIFQGQLAGDCVRTCYLVRSGVLTLCVCLDVILSVGLTLASNAAKNQALNVHNIWYIIFIGSSKLVTHKKFIKSAASGETSC